MALNTDVILHSRYVVWWPRNDPNVFRFRVRKCRWHKKHLQGNYRVNKISRTGTEWHRYSTHMLEKRRQRVWRKTKWPRNDPNVLRFKVRKFRWQQRNCTINKMSWKLSGVNITSTFKEKGDLLKVREEGKQVRLVSLEMSELRDLAK